MKDLLEESCRNERQLGLMNDGNDYADNDLVGNIVQNLRQSSGECQNRPFDEPKLSPGYLYPRQGEKIDSGPNVESDFEVIPSLELGTDLVCPVVLSQRFKKLGKTGNVDVDSC